MVELKSLNMLALEILKEECSIFMCFAFGYLLFIFYCVVVTNFRKNTAYSNIR